MKPRFKVARVTALELSLRERGQREGWGRGRSLGCIRGRHVFPFGGYLPICVSARCMGVA